jgi:hypothetical protein
MTNPHARRREQPTHAARNLSTTDEHALICPYTHARAALSPQSDQEAAPAQWVSHFKPNATLSIIDHFTAYTRANVPQPVRTRALAGAPASLGLCVQECPAAQSVQDSRPRLPGALLPLLDPIYP